MGSLSHSVNWNTVNSEASQFHTERLANANWQIADWPELYGCLPNDVTSGRLQHRKSGATTHSSEEAVIIGGLAAIAGYRPANEL